MKTNDEKVLVEKELTTESIEYIVDTKHALKRQEASMNKDMIYAIKMLLTGLYKLLQLEGYSEKHLRTVIYSETFEHKGIKY